MKTLTQAAKTAKTIKEILKKEYSNIKFSVRSDNFAGGDSVDVSWIDGIPSNTLDTFLRQFEYGSFDAMTDTYNYDNKHNFPQAKYVHSKREISEEKREIIKSQLAAFMNIENVYDAEIPKDYMINVRGYAFSAPLSALVYQITVNFDFTKGFHGVRNKLTEKCEKIVNMFELY